MGNDFEKHVYHFLLIQAIPKHKNRDRIYDAAFKAHRDVLSGRFWLKEYCKASKDSGHNTPLETLIAYIRSTKLSNGNEAIGSEILIEYLSSKFPSFEFGAIQKLVNMTLKYLFLLYKYGEEKDLEDYHVDISKYDCPIDSIILKRLPEPHSKWTKMDQKEYESVQKEIRTLLTNHNIESGNLYYDFEAWDK